MGSIGPGCEPVTHTFDHGNSFTVTYIVQTNGQQRFSRRNTLFFRLDSCCTFIVDMKHAKYSMYVVSIQ